jgi:Flp pilus assembly protein TadD
MELADGRARSGIAWSDAEYTFRPRAGAPTGSTPAAESVDVQALLLLGLSVAMRGQTARAAAIFDRVAQEWPDGPHPCEDLASLLPRLSQDAVAAQYRACLRVAPEDMRLRQAFARFLRATGDSSAAVAVLRDGLRHDPSSAVTQHAIGITLAELAHIPEAIWHLEQAVGINPKFASGWASLGLLLRAERRFDSALAAYEQAIARAPGEPRFRVDRALTLLHAGRWTEAWPEFEWRLQLRGGSRLPPERLLRPQAHMTDGLNGRTVLLTHEGGVGDTVQCLRYVPLLVERGARVVAWLPASLERLAGAMPGVAEVSTAAMAPPRFDLHCPFFTLPRVFQTTPVTIPRPPYLQADPRLAAAWARCLPVAGMRVGLVWGAQARPLAHGLPRLDRRRSVGLAGLASLAAIPGLCFVSLQKGAAAEQARTPPPGMVLCDPTPDIEDFADTAAVIANLDVVVSVDTAVAHVAGAMGKPVFLLDRYDNCWRWLSGRADSPWYPSMTIFRQERMGDWGGAVSRAAAALEAMAVFRGASD